MECKLFVMDTDGVLTDGGMYYSEGGEGYKKFNTRDGMGIELLRKNGVMPVIITKENSEIATARAAKLKVEEVHIGVENKLKIIGEIVEKHDFSFEEVVYIGDDINDIPLLKGVGFSCCPSNAIDEVKSIVNYVCKAKGGEGAVREVVDIVLSQKSQSVKCYLCGSNCKKIHDNIRYNFPFKPYKCDNCGLVFLFPYFTSTEQKEFYEHEYRKLYGNVSPEKNFNDSLSEAKIRAERFNYLFSKDKDVLEIGCSTGYFLSELRGRVRGITGVELTTEYANYASGKGITVVNSINELEDDSFDLIFMFFVLEHLSEPVSFLKELKNKLKTNGKLIIEVPNVEDVLVHTYKVKTYLDFYWQPAHRFYFSKRTLSLVLDKAGYFYTIFPLQRYDLSNHIYWMLFGKVGGQKHFNNIFSEALLKEYEKALKERFVCDTIYTVAEQKFT